MSMEQNSNSPPSQGQDLICPITLNIYRDPVLAGDGHIYERFAITRWIEQQGTSPLTRESLDVNDLHSEENIRQLCQSHRSNCVTHSCQSSMISLPPSPITQENARSERQIPCKQYCNIKRTLLITIAISFIISPFIIATAIILCLDRSKPISSIMLTSTKYPKNYTYPLTTYILPNECTLSKIIPLFAWNNVQDFNYTYYSKLYKAVTTRTIITFAFRHSSSYWCLNDVSMIDTSLKTELVTNGGFENNPSNGFFRCNSSGNGLTTLFMVASQPHNGGRSFCDGTVDGPDYLSQVLSTQIGQVYNVSFWLQNNGNAPNSAQVVMSY